MSPVSSAIPIGALLLAVLSCGDAVSNPSTEGFESDPRVIQGDWASDEIVGQEIRRLRGELQPASGVFLGTFEMFLAGQQFTLVFSDGLWDGSTLEFSAPTPIGDDVRTVPWVALFLAEDEGRPSRLRLSSEAFPALSIDFCRPTALPNPFC